MNWAPGGLSQHQATGAAGVCGIIFYQLALFHYKPDFASTNHSIGSQHLLQRVREKQYSLPRGFSNSYQNVGIIVHISSLRSRRLTFNGHETAHHAFFTKATISFRLGA